MYIYNIYIYYIYIYIYIIQHCRKKKSGKVNWIASGEQEAIKYTYKPCFYYKKCVNNVDKFNKNKQYICGLRKTVNYWSKECQKKQ